MKYLFPALLLLFAGSFQDGRAQTNHDFSHYKQDAQKIIEAALNDDMTFRRLTDFVDAYPHRLSGSKSLEQSIDWILKTMNNDSDLDLIRTQQVMVPHWVRGEESVTLVSPRKRNMPMLGLGGSIGTPEQGIEAEVLVVNSFEELESKSAQVKGKIVLYNVPFTSYGETVQYRLNGAVEAAKHGAVASLIRTVGDYSMKTPHTGTSRYADGVKNIPHAAITIEDAKLLQRMQNRGQTITVNLKMQAKTLADAESRNIIAEIKGSEHPDEIIVIGGHIDGWDVGQGAMDDAGGCFAAWQALRIISKLGLQPRRTIRLVMWTNEENGLRGAEEYKNMVQANNTLNDHVLAIESDSGVFDPEGFGFSGSDEAFAMIKAIGNLLIPIEAGDISRGGGGADIGPIMREGVPGMGLNVDGAKYFWYHHSRADTIDKLNKDDFNECVAALAVMAYVAADADQTLPR
jgi:carboxypeptidase Q